MNRFAPVLPLVCLSMVVFAQVDMDDDGMSDDWEAMQGLSASDPKDAWLDPDQDQVINLFEYQLNTDPFDPFSPLAMEVADQTGSDNINFDIQSGVKLFRFAAGTYDFALNIRLTDLANGMKVMFQGGWNEDFSSYDPCQHETILSNSAGSELFNLNTETSDASAAIFDGMTMDRGVSPLSIVSMDLKGSGVAAMSVFNCTILDNGVDNGGVLDYFVEDNGAVDVWLGNTLIADNGGNGIQFSTGNAGQGRLHVLQSTIINQINNIGIRGYGITGFVTDDASFYLTIKNSVLSGNKGKDLDLFGSDNGEIEVAIENSLVNEIESFGNVETSNALVLRNESPIYINQMAGLYALSAESPGAGVGQDLGLPGFPSNPDFGIVDCSERATSNFSKPERSIALTISPNPSVDYIQIVFEQENIEVLDVVVYNMNGSLVKRPALGTDRFSQFDLSVSDLPAGIYQLSILTKYGQLNAPFVKQ